MGEPIVAVDGLWKVFGGVTAVRDLSFTVNRGQVYGLLGPNGAGKTTTLRVLMGLERPTRGETRLFGMPVVPGCDAILRVGAMVEEAAFVPHLSGMRNLRLWWEARGRGWPTPIWTARWRSLGWATRSTAGSARTAKA